jgi:hypothetical protein
MMHGFGPRFTVRAVVATMFVLAACFAGGSVARAQGTELVPARSGVDTILLPASCTLDNPAQRGNLSALTAQSGLIQNLGAAAVNLTCALVRTGGLPRVAVSIDVRPGSQPVRARVVAADTSTGNSVGLQTVNLISGPGGRGFLRVTGAFPAPLSDNSGIVLRVTLGQGDTLGRILVSQRPDPNPLASQAQ